MSEKETDIVEVENEFEFNNTFICPHCNALATHEWSYAYNELEPTKILKWEFKSKEYFIQDNKNFIFSQCPNRKCEKYSIWLEDILIYPDKSTIPVPNPDLNKDIKRIYNEASSIYNKSPRAACALLRLTLEELCKNLGATDENVPAGETRLRDRIKYLVREKDLDVEIEEAFENVRLAGNEALHTGEINLTDNREIAKLLFDMINIIADDLITKKKKIKKLRKAVTKDKKQKDSN